MEGDAGRVGVGFEPAVELRVVADRTQVSPTAGWPRFMCCGYFEM
jgi:hypothetical protein